MGVDVDILLGGVGLDLLQDLVQVGDGCQFVLKLFREQKDRTHLQLFMLDLFQLLLLAGENPLEFPEGVRYHGLGDVFHVLVCYLVYVSYYH